MTDPPISICVVSWQAAYSLSLLWEGYQRYNPDFPAKLLVLDNASTDGALEYAKRQADLVLLGNNTKNHGWGLTELVRRADTPYVLTMDNDAFFTRPGAVAYMMKHMSLNTLCVCPDRPHTAGKGRSYGHNGTIEWGPDISCALFRTDVIQRICEHFHFGYYGDLVSERVYETGGMVWRVGQVLGLDSVEPPNMGDYVRHVGNMSGLWVGCPKYPDPSEMEETLRINPAYSVAFEEYNRIKRELAEVRGVRVENLDSGEPPARNVAQVIDLDWKPPAGTHIKLIPGAGLR